MNTNIKKTSTLNSKDNAVIITSANISLKKYNLSDKEIMFIQEEIKKDKTLISVNQYDRIIFIYILKKNTDKSKLIEICRKDGHKIQTLIQENKIEEITIIDTNNFSIETLALAEGLALSNYQFIKYFSNSKKKEFTLKSILIFGKKISAKDILHLQISVNATHISRNLVNEPANYQSAVQFSKDISKIGKDAGFKVEVFNLSKIQSLKMGGLLAVNKGSINPPTFSILEWKPKNARNKKPLVLVGKGVVYDTGGMNIKTAGMDTMKCDMAGAATVVGTLYAVAKSELPYHVIGLIPATDNRPDGNAYVPGDVITMFDGTTVEIINTDAEGRVILADALSYAKKYNPELVIDLATLTGAAQRAIGNYGIVGMGNASKSIKEKLYTSGYNVYERIAEFPFWDEYADEIKSSVADIKNLGSASGGAITAGKFLEHFTDYPWYHLDIAGPAFNEKNDSYRGKGGTGVGVRLLFDFIKNKNEI